MSRFRVDGIFLNKSSYEISFLMVNSIAAQSGGALLLAATRGSTVLRSQCIALVGAFPHQHKPEATG